MLFCSLLDEGAELNPTAPECTMSSKSLTRVLSKSISLRSSWPSSLESKDAVGEAEKPEVSQRKKGTATSTDRKSKAATIVSEDLAALTVFSPDGAYGSSKFSFAPSTKLANGSRPSDECRFMLPLSHQVVQRGCFGGQLLWGLDFVLGNSVMFQPSDLRADRVSNPYVETVSNYCSQIHVGIGSRMMARILPARARKELSR
mmetsp:Transcript_61158/g.126281  ORF Transcript_61158/g.126281 Transcript_61158/m.126281 type:complete len:202 (-) Transcript_61158:3-608(-)